MFGCVCVLFVSCCAAVYGVLVLCVLLCLCILFVMHRVTLSGVGVFCVFFVIVCDQ